MNYQLHHILKMEDKWYAEITKIHPDNTTSTEHTRSLWGKEGMAYSSLKIMLAEYYNINLPPQKELKLLKSAKGIQIYVTEEPLINKADKPNKAKNKKVIEIINTLNKKTATEQKRLAFTNRNKRALW